MTAHHAMTFALDEHESARARDVVIPTFGERFASAWWSLASRIAYACGSTELGDHCLMRAIFGAAAAGLFTATSEYRERSDAP